MIGSLSQEIRLSNLLLKTDPHTLLTLFVFIPLSYMQYAMVLLLSYRHELSLQDRKAHLS